MSINRISILILFAKSRKSPLALALLSCLLICLLPFLPVIADIEAVPGQSIEGQLSLLVENDPGHQISIQPPADVSEWSLTPGEASEISGTMNVKTNKDGWQVTASDSDPITAGHMTEWTGSAYGSRRLTNPMKVKAASEVTLPTVAIIQTGDKAQGQGIDIRVVFHQDGSFEDEPLPVGHVYHIVVTFTGSYS